MSATFEWVEAPATERVAEFPVRNVRHGVPYDSLERAVEIGRRVFPGATNIVALWTPNSSLAHVCIEVEGLDPREPRRRRVFGVPQC